MLQMAVAKYKRPICIVSKDFPIASILLSNGEVDTARCMFLGYSGCDHYDSILPCPTIYSAVSTAAAASVVYPCDGREQRERRVQRVSTGVRFGDWWEVNMGGAYGQMRGYKRAVKLVWCVWGIDVEGLERLCYLESVRSASIRVQSDVICRYM